MTRRLALLTSVFGHLGARLPNPLNEFEVERALLAVRLWCYRRLDPSVATLREARATIDALSERCNVLEEALRDAHRREERRHPARLLPHRR